LEDSENLGEEEDFLKIEQILVRYNQIALAGIQKHGSSTSYQINVSRFARKGFLKCCLVFGTKNKTLEHLRTFLRDYFPPSPSSLEKAIES
jgi:hypothetical protein